VLPGHPHIGLYQPEIPQNTGSIGRLAAGAGCRLHLVRPFGFSIDDKNLRRPGLDYWPFLDLEIHDDLAQLLALFPPGRVAFLSKKADRPYTAIPADVELLLFGRETNGFPDELHARFADSFYGIPLYHPGVRSLNLANAVAVVVYDRLMRRSSP
jgi:tRNA (cytidine/uridine-2'-O-)-methyltransferase